MENEKFKITCDECGNSFYLGDLEIKKADKVKIEDKTFDITYFKCKECGKLYLIEMLDFRAEKLKKKFQKISNSINKKNRKVSEERMKELEEAKQIAVEYQKYLADNYADKIPTNCLDL